MQNWNDRISSFLGQTSNKFLSNEIIKENIALERNQEVQFDIAMERNQGNFQQILKLNR